MEKLRNWLDVIAVFTLLIVLMYAAVKLEHAEQDADKWQVRAAQWKGIACGMDRTVEGCVFNGPE